MRWLLGLALVTACGSESLPAADLDAERFTARGRVTAVRSTEVEIHHERIDSIRTALGTLEPMDPMTMVFAATQNARVDGIAVGDIVRVEFTTNYKIRPPLRLVAIDKLPAETRLALPPK
jgi:Cu/Ag efflux protein CusF